MNVLMVVAKNDFRDDELLAPKAALEAAGHRVTVASTVAGPCIGLKDARVMATVELDEARSEDFGAAVFVGGPGAQQLFNDVHAQRLAREMLAAAKPTGAIGTAPLILARAGALVHRRVAAFPADRIEIAEAGAFPVMQPLVVDGQLVTANGSAAAKPFADELVALLARRIAA